MNSNDYENHHEQVLERGLVQGIYIAPRAEAAMLSLHEALLIEGRGIQGDRYFLGTGTHSTDEDDEPSYEITLIEHETIVAINREKQLGIKEDAPRRNIVTRGIGLNHLVHRYFRIGEVLLYGVALREPCIHLAETASHRFMVSLIHRGGLGAKIVSGGTIHVGDTIQEAHLALP